MPGEPEFSHHEALNEAVKQACRHFAQSGLLVLSGPSGAGKTHLAGLIHGWTGQGECVFQDAAGLAQARFESQLFGHVKGAFSGASHSFPGLLGMVAKGTLCLEGVNDLASANQAKMLRFLQERRYRPVGGTLETDFPGRMILTATGSLQDLRRENRLREDFYHRIAATELVLPPFRERPLDFPAICRTMTSAMMADLPPDMRPPSEEALAALDPAALVGNGHGLYNLLQRAIISGEPLRQEPPAAAEAYRLPATGSLKEDLLQLEKRLLQRGLQRHPQARRELAGELGISLRALMYKLRQHDLN